MKNSYTTRGKETLAEFTARRKRCLGGSDIASVMGVGRYGCAKKLFLDKTGVQKDEDDSDRMELRRGHRLEHIAASLYEEKTGRSVYYTSPMTVLGKPHLSVTMDRLTYKKDDEKKENPGYLELKVVGRGSWYKIKKEGLIDDYILQVQYGCAVGGLSWGAYGIYCPDLDDFMEWDVEADKELGAILLDKADDFWNFNVECGVEPDALPEDSPPCGVCPWSLTCRGKSLAEIGAAKTFSRPDLEPLAAKYREISGMEKEIEDAKASVREELLEKIAREPGSYVFGRFSATFTKAEQKRFSGEALKKEHPELYEKYRKPAITETLRIKE